MKRFVVNSVTMLAMLLAGAASRAQRAPASSSVPWQGNLPVTAPPRSTPAFAPDPSKTYTLPELVNLAEQNNPETRVAWENAKARAADLGISKATLYPTVAAAAVAETDRNKLLFYPAYIRDHYIPSPPPSSWTTPSSISADGSMKLPSVEAICLRQTCFSTTPTEKSSTR